MRPEFGETWVYESLVGAIPGLHLKASTAIAIQIVVFEGAMLAVAAIYDLWSAVPVGTVAVAVAGVGSWLMLRFSRTVREVSTPEPYRRLLFGSSVEVALSVLAFVLFVTYVFVVDPRQAEASLLTRLFGQEPPAIAVALMLLICWDVVYRIGTCWWATVVGLWRAIQYGFDGETTRRFLRIDALNVVFAGVQMALVPFVVDRPILAAALVGHLVAVIVVSALAILIQQRRVTTGRTLFS
jgi:hypothetical protein